MEHRYHVDTDWLSGLRAKAQSLLIAPTKLKAYATSGSEKSPERGLEGLETVGMELRGVSKRVQASPSNRVPGHLGHFGVPLSLDLKHLQLPAKPE